MKTNTLSLFLLVLCPSLGIGIPSTHSQDLLPPGPPGPTMKTLVQVEPGTPISSIPFTIDQAGFYYLTDNQTGINGSHGILINSSNVLLDLHGFSLQGVSGSLDGISITAESNVTVLNGSISGWGGNGISGIAPYSRFENLQTVDNALAGFVGEGTGSLFQNCVSRQNSSGFYLSGALCVLDKCSAVANGGVGFEPFPDANFTSCAAIKNVSHGFSLLGGGAIVDKSFSANNLERGFRGFDVTFTGSVARDNGSTGILANQGTVRDCRAYRNAGNGIDCARSVVSNCTARENSVYGFEAIGGIIKNCVSEGNTTGQYHILQGALGIENWQP